MIHSNEFWLTQSIMLNPLKSNKAPGWGKQYTLASIASTNNIRMTNYWVLDKLSLAAGDKME